MMSDDEFYIGYEQGAPPAVLRRVRRAVAAVAAVGVAIAAIVTWAQRPLAKATFAYGDTREWAGYLSRVPAPALLVPVASGVERYWLVARGKRGAEFALDGVPDGWVVVRGSEVRREWWRMIEIAAAAPAARPAGVPAPAPPRMTDGRLVSVRGEIVDSKCYLGVMNPGERTVHRDCAVRCLAGGVTPMVAFDDEDGTASLAVLVNHAGVLPDAAARYDVGGAVTLTGRLFAIDDGLVLRVDAGEGDRR